jgi:hypothetical protein
MINGYSEEISDGFKRLGGDSQDADTCVVKKAVKIVERNGLSDESRRDTGRASC